MLGAFVLWPSSVQVAGQALMPGAAFFEMAVAAAWKLMLFDERRGLDVGVSDLIIPAPLALGKAPASPAIALHCELEPLTGQIDIVSSTLKGSVVHVSCRAAIVLPSPTQMPLKGVPEVCAATFAHLYINQAHWQGIDASPTGAVSQVETDIVNNGFCLGIGQSDSALQLGQVKGPTSCCASLVLSCVLTLTLLSGTSILRGCSGKRA